MENLKISINKLIKNEIKLNLLEYNSLIYQCAVKYEMAAVVFLYDHMKLNGSCVAR